MKLSLLTLFTSFTLISGFTTPLITTSKVVKSTTAIKAVNDRRSFLKTTQTLASAAFVTTVLPNVASAAEYVPKFEDIKVLYSLAASLDKLAEKCADPDQSETILSSVRIFNKDPNFYPGYARNFISKTVKNNADGDSRVGYVRQACNGIGSLQELLEGRQGLEGKDASAEAVKRVKKAQALLAKFFAGSGVEDDKVKAFIASHSS